MPEPVISPNAPATIESVVENTTEPSKEQSLESLQTETTEQKPDTPQPRQSTFEIGDKTYSINEEQIRKYYGIAATEEITDKEWKTIVSNYKTNIQYNNKNREASDLKKQAEDVFKKLFESPKETLKALFEKSPDKLKATLEEMLLEEIENDMLDPRDREIKELKRQAQLQIEQEKQKLLQEQEKQMLAMEQHYTAQIESEIISALDTSGLPKTSGTVKRIASYLLQGAKKNMDLKVTDVIPLVREDYELEIKELFGNATPELLQKFLGDGKLKEIRNADLKRIKNGIIDGRNIPTEGKEIEIRKPSERKSLTPDEFRAIAKRKISQIK